MSQSTHPCPKCGRRLRQTANASISTTRDSLDVTVFQCSECVVQTDLSGTTVELALTFAVDADGRIVTPLDPGLGLNCDLGEGTWSA